MKNSIILSLLIVSALVFGSLFYLSISLTGNIILDDSSFFLSEDDNGEVIIYINGAEKLDEDSFIFLVIANGREVLFAGSVSPILFLDDSKASLTDLVNISLVKDVKYEFSLQIPDLNLFETHKFVSD